MEADINGDSMITFEEFRDIFFEGQRKQEKKLRHSQSKVDKTESFIPWTRTKKKMSRLENDSVKPKISVKNHLDHLFFVVDPYNVL